MSNLLGEITIEDQIVCVRREIGKRKSVYPRLIEVGKMKMDQAHREISVMEAVLKTLELLRDE